MIKITIDDREVQKMLRDLAGRVKDRRPLMQKIAGIMKDAVDENFKAEGRPKWKPSVKISRVNVSILVLLEVSCRVSAKIPS
jgi:phage gpG-like protein